MIDCPGRFLERPGLSKPPNMAKQDILPYQQNLALKREFEYLRLDLGEIMVFTPFDLDLENRRLQSLFDFVGRYRQYGSRAVMEAVEGRFVFPPVFPDISPESDWYRFEQWMQGKPVRQKLSEMLLQTTAFRMAGAIGDDEIEAELKCLENALDQAGYRHSLNPDVPARLVYAYLYKMLDETFEVDEPGEGGWCIDGCSGYCPGCFQRPWCEFGESSCWTEDETSGKMHLTDELSEYVSASPQSLQILQRLQAAEDAAFEKFKTEYRDTSFGGSAKDQEWKARLN